MKAIEAWNNDKLPDIIWAIIPSTIREKLKNKIQFKFDERNLNKDSSLHHVTIVYKPKENDIAFIKEWAKENEPINIEILENCWNEKIQALKVKIYNSKNKELIIPNKIFHITISAEKGIKPVESNNMLSSIHNTEKFESIITGTLYFDKF